MQRVHQMILAEVGADGLAAARSSLKKTAVTTVVRRDGTRLAVTRDDDGAEHEEVIGRREVDSGYLGIPTGHSARDTASIDSVQTLQPATKPKLSCEEDILDVSDAPRFDIDDEAFLGHLREHGYVIVKDVASPSDMSSAEDLLWQFLQENAGFERSDPSTWSDDNFERVGCVGTGIIDGAGVGQSDFLWHLRLLPRVREAFAKIWGTNDLLSSFDAANIFRPWQHERFGFTRTHGGWYHLDQGRGAPGFQSVQGLVTLLDVDASTGGLVVVPGSHKKHEDLVRYQYSDENYVSVPASDPILELPKKLVTCRAGDLVLWDSRCVHCNAPGRRSLRPCVTAEASADEPVELLRMVGYVCMTPKSKASEEVLCQRRQLYRDRLTTSHWPHLLSTVRAGKKNKAGCGPPLDIDDDQTAADRRALIC